MIWSLKEIHNTARLYDEIIMGAMASQITSFTIVYSTVYLGADQIKQSYASLAFVWGIDRGPVNSPHKGPVTRKMFLFDDVIMDIECVASAEAYNVSSGWFPAITRMIGPGSNYDLDFAWWRHQMETFSA